MVDKIRICNRNIHSEEELKEPIQFKFKKISEMNTTTREQTRRSFGLFSEKNVEFEFIFRAIRLNWYKNLILNSPNWVSNVKLINISKFTSFTNSCDWIFMGFIQNCWIDVLLRFWIQIEQTKSQSICIPCHWSVPIVAKYARCERAEVEYYHTLEDDAALFQRKRSHCDWHSV